MRHLMEALRELCRRYDPCRRIVRLFKVSDFVPRVIVFIREFITMFCKPLLKRRQANSLRYKKFALP